MNAIPEMQPLLLDIAERALSAAAGDLSASASLLARIGNSLAATRLAAELSDASQVTVSLRDLFECRTAAQLVERLQARRTDGLKTATHLQPLPVARHRNRTLLSFSQERMAFMQDFASTSAAYHVAFGLELSGPVDILALRRALETFPQRHTQFRLRFISFSEGVSCLPKSSDRMPVQQIYEFGAGEERFAEIATEFSNAPFDLEAGETARALLVGLGPSHWRLVVACHHVVLDAFSFELMIEDIGREYQQLVTEHKPAGTGWADVSGYSQWHRRWFREHAFANDRAFWISQLTGSQRSTIEPDFSRPLIASYRGDRVEWKPSPALWNQLRASAAQQGVTVAAYLFAVFNLWLRSFANSNDLTVGLAAANRHHANADRLMGTLVNLLALRIQVKTDQSLGAFVQQVQEQMLAALDHQDMPFEVLVRQMQLERAPGESPLIGVLFNMVNIPAPVRSWGAVQLRRIEVDRKASQFDLTVTVDDQHQHALWFDYATDLYARSTIELAAQRFAAILEAALANPGQSVTALPVQGTIEADLVRSWGQGQIAALPAVGFARWFIRLVERAGDQVAIVDERSVLDYRELNRLSARFAGALRGLGLQAGDRVGLMLTRHSEAVIAMLGCLRAGVAFVPLDPAFPEGRLAYMIEDAGVKHIVHSWDSEPAQRFVSDAITWHSVKALVTKSSPGVDHNDASGKLAAYVLYTSGSTGRPKGVEVSQQALMNLLVGMSQTPGMRAEDSLLAVTTWGFDISLLEVFLPLVSGARLIIASREQVLDGKQLSQLLESYRVTHLQATPATWIQLLESGWTGARQLHALVGGEALSVELAARLLPQVRELWNMYGPTETTIWSTCHRVLEAKGTSIALGRPILNTRVVVLHTGGTLAGASTVGEIAIGGRGVASGYVGKPDLTRERFAPVAIGTTELFYRTGDLGRWNAEGLLEFRGRADRQLKLRGFRIEPGEIESVAASVGGVERAIVLLEQSESPNARLVLHVQSAVPREPLISPLIDALRAKLPDYMVPPEIHIWLQFPLLPNGKVDAAQLRALAPKSAVSLVASELDSPQDDLERRLKQIWQELLGTSDIGRHDNFFERGGHSLLAMRLVARIREDLGKHCSLQLVFQGATLAGLARSLRSSAPLDASRTVALRIEGNEPALFCICGVLIYRALAQRMRDGVPVRAIYLPMEPGRRRVEDLAAEYVAEIRRQQAHGPYRVIGFSLGGVLAFEIAQQLTRANETVEFVGVLDSDAPGRTALAELKKVWDGLRSALIGDEAAESRVPDYIQAMRSYQAIPGKFTLCFFQAAAADDLVASAAWGRLTPDLSVVPVPSDHMGILQEPAVGQVAAEISRRLKRPLHSS